MLKDDLFEEKGQLTAVVYAPEHRDAQGHIASADVIEKMAHSFMEEGAKLDIKHNLKDLKKNQAYVAESFIIQKGDPRFTGIKDHLGKETDPTGGWGMILQLLDEDLKKQYREGKWNGVSLFSYPGEYQLEPEDDPVKKALDEFQRRLQGKSDFTMDKNELADLLKANNEALIAALKPKEEKKEEPKSGGPEDGKPIFKGDFTDIEALKKFQNEVQLYELRQKYDFTEPTQLAKYVEELEEFKKSNSREQDSNEDQRKSDSSDSDPETQRLEAQVEALQKELAKKKKQSKAPITDTSNDSFLAKDTQDAWNIGLDIAKIANERRRMK